MLKDKTSHTTIPVTDLQRARAFYGETLGFDVETSNEGGTMYHAGNGTHFFVYQTGAPSSGAHTVIGFTVTDVRSEVAELRSRGVVFEEYDYPTLKTQGGIADTGPGLAAWFKDPDGNIIGMIQFRAE